MLRKRKNDVSLQCPFAKALTSCYIVCWVVNGQVGQAALGALLATPFFISPKPIPFSSIVSALLNGSI